MSTIVFVYFMMLANFRIAFSIISAWPLLPLSRNKAMISETPLGGFPLSRFATIACNAPAQAPRLPSQYSGFGSSL